MNVFILFSRVSLSIFSEIFDDTEIASDMSSELTLVLSSRLVCISGIDKSKLFVNLFFKVFILFI